MPINRSRSFLNWTQYVGQFCRRNIWLVLIFGILLFAIAIFFWRQHTIRATLRDYAIRHHLTHCPNSHTTLVWCPVIAGTDEKDWNRGAGDPYPYGNINSSSPAYVLECATCGFAYQSDDSSWISNDREQVRQHGTSIKSVPAAIRSYQGTWVYCKGKATVYEKVLLTFDGGPTEWQRLREFYEDWMTSDTLTISEQDNDKNRLTIEGRRKPIIDGDYTKAIIFLINDPEIWTSISIQYGRKKVGPPNVIDYPTYYEAHWLDSLLETIKYEITDAWDWVDEKVQDIFVSF